MQKKSAGQRYRRGERQYTFERLPGLSGGEATTGCELVCESDEKLARIWLPGFDLSSFAAFFGYGVETPELPVEIGALVMEHLLSPLLEELEARSGKRFQFGWLLSECSVPADAEFIRWRAECDGYSLEFGLLPSENEGILDWLDRHLPDRPARREPIDVPFRVTLLSDEFRLSAEAVEALREGDVLQTNRPEGAPLGRWLMLNGACIASSTVDETGALMVAELYPNREVRMDENFQDYGEELEKLNLSDIPVTLSVELGRTTVSFLEVQDLTEGSLMPFDSSRPEKVSLLANGRKIADAELVMIESKVGFRITKMA